jgi:hypothetical protein
MGTETRPKFSRPFQIVEAMTRFQHANILDVKRDATVVCANTLETLAGFAEKRRKFPSAAKPHPGNPLPRSSTVETSPECTLRCLPRRYSSRNADNKAKVTIRKSYGFRTCRVLELAPYHSLGKLPEPESTHDYFERAKIFDLTTEFRAC